MRVMARGWESKTVEEQISAAEAESEAASKAPLTPEQVERRSKREGLLLQRACALNDLRATRHERRRALLERTLEHLDRQLAELESLESR